MAAGTRTRGGRSAESGWTWLVVAGTGLITLAFGLMAGLFSAPPSHGPAYTYAGIVGAALVGVLFLLGLIVTLTIGVIALVVRRWWLVACFMLGAGFIGGYAGGIQIARATGQSWEQQPVTAPSMPTYFGGFGTATGRLDGVPGFVSRTGGAECHSGPDSQAVAHVYAEDAGGFRGAVLRAELYLYPVAGDRDVVGITAIYFWSPGMTAAWPSWEGQGRLTESSAMSGRVTFQGLAAVPTREPPAGSWPATLSGEIAWTCDPWQGQPSVPGAVEVPPVR